MSHTTIFRDGLIKDTYLDQVNPLSKLGSSTSIRIGSISSGRGGSGFYNAWHSVHSVTTSPTSGPNIPSNAHIISATLKLEYLTNLGGIFAYKTRSVLENLVSPVEAEATWDLDEAGGVLWAGGELFSDNNPARVTTWFPPASGTAIIDITEQVKYCFDNFSGLISLLSGFKSSITDDYTTFYSSDFSDLSKRPIIEIVWEPVLPINNNATLIISGPLTRVDYFPLFINTGNVPKTGVLDLSVRSPWNSCSWAEQRSPWNDYTSMTWENWCGISGAGINSTGIDFYTSGSIEIKSSGDFPLYINPIESTGNTSGFLNLFSNGPIEFSGLFPLFLKTDLVPSGNIPLSIKGVSENQSGFIFDSFNLYTNSNSFLQSTGNFPLFVNVNSTGTASNLPVTAFSSSSPSDTHTLFVRGVSDIAKGSLKLFLNSVTTTGFLDLFIKGHWSLFGDPVSINNIPISIIDDAIVRESLPGEEDPPKYPWETPSSSPGVASIILNETAPFQHNYHATSIDGAIPSRNLMPLFLRHEIGAGSGMNLYIQGSVQSSGNIDLYTSGFQISSGSLDLYLHNQNPIGNLPLYTRGYSSD